MDLLSQLENIHADVPVRDLDSTSLGTNLTPYQRRIQSELECDDDCPLRAGLSYNEDPPLPLPKDALSLTRGEASAQLYTPIKEWQTRLLQLHPGEFGTISTASLVVVDIIHLPGSVLHNEQRRVDYTALSYTWGRGEFRRSIWLNSVQCPITESLYAFLQRYRSAQESLYIWIDSLCINQFDLKEKSAQVGQMLTIYQKAKSVTVWLGEESTYTKLAVAFIKWSSDGHNMDAHPDKCFLNVSDLLNGIEDLCTRQWIRRIVRISSHSFFPKVRVL